VGETAVEEAYNRLSNASHYFLRRILCEYDNGTLFVSGKVPSYYLKQLVHSRLRGIEGVQQIEDQIQVVSPTGLSSDPVTGYPLRMRTPQRETK
jgi:osmotically-inducible protein OsmY